MGFISYDGRLGAAQRQQEMYNQITRERYEALLYRGYRPPDPALLTPKVEPEPTSKNFREELQEETDNWLNI